MGQYLVCKKLTSIHTQRTKYGKAGAKVNKLPFCSICSSKFKMFAQKLKLPSGHDTSVYRQWAMRRGAFEIHEWHSNRFNSVCNSQQTKRFQDCNCRIKRAHTMVSEDAKLWNFVQILRFCGLDCNWWMMICKAQCSYVVWKRHWQPRFENAKFPAMKFVDLKDQLHPAVEMALTAIDLRDFCYKR